MPFTVKFYNISVPTNTLDKGEPGEGITGKSCSPFEQVSGLNGNILLDYDSAVEANNYCQITGGGRTLYCYVKGFSLETGKRMRVQLEIDPLMTNKTGILACAGVLDRTNKEGDWDLYLDGDRIVYSYGLLKGTPLEGDELDFDTGNVYCGIFG